MAVFITWKLEQMKNLFKLTFKREVVTLMLEYSCFDYFFEVLFSNITVNINNFKIFLLLIFWWMLSWNNTTVKVYEIFSEKLTGPWNIYLYGPLDYKTSFVKPSGPLSYILNVLSLIRLRWACNRNLSRSKNKYGCNRK